MAKLYIALILSVTLAIFCALIIGLTNISIWIMTGHGPIIERCFNG